MYCCAQQGSAPSFKHRYRGAEWKVETRWSHLWMLWIQLIFSLIDYHFCSLGAALQQPVGPALQDKPCLHENRVSVQLPGSGATCWPPASETPGGSESPALPNIQGTDVCRCEDLLSVVNYALKSHIVFWRSHTNLMVLCLKVNNLNLCLAQAVWKVEAQLEASWCWFLHFILWLMVCLDPRVFLETKPVHVFFFCLISLSLYVILQ